EDIISNSLPTPATVVAPVPALTLDAARAQIPALVKDHAIGGEGFLVLAHPPGTGKGQGATQGLVAYLRETPELGPIVWTAPRSQQYDDQSGLDLIPLHGRRWDNCHKLPEAQTLAAKGYGVREALCQHRCPFVSHCAYLGQFSQQGDFFAP